MVKLNFTDTGMEIDLEGIEKFLAVKSKLSIPYNHIVNVEENEAINFLILLDYLWNKVDTGISIFGLAEDKRIITYLNIITIENRQNART